MTVQMSHFTYLLFACDDAILHLLSNFHTNRSKWRRNIEEKFFSMHSTAMLHLQILDFFCQITILRIEIRICVPNLIEVG